MDAKGSRNISMKAASNFSNKQYAIVTGLANNYNYAAIATASNVWPIGVLQNAPNASGKAADVAVNGVAKIKIAGLAGSKLTIGSPIVATASGFGHSLATTGGIPVGRAMQGGSSGDIVSVLLQATNQAGGGSVGVK